MLSNALNVLKVTKQLQADSFLYEKFETGLLKIEVGMVVFLSIDVTISEDDRLKIHEKLIDLGYIERRSHAFDQNGVITIYPHGYYSVEDDNKIQNL